MIQVFVEALDKCFENVCELDLVYHCDKCHYILDEIVMGGMVLETNINLITTAINDQEKLSAASLSNTNANLSLSPAASTNSFLSLLSESLSITSRS